MQSVSSRIWTRVSVSISYDDNHYTTGTFVDELYSATFVKELGIPNHFFINLLINSLIVSNFVSDTSYICNGHANLGINPK